MNTAYRGAVRYTLSVVSAIVISFTAMSAQAEPGGGGGGPGKVTCSINDPGAVTVGVPATFSAEIQSKWGYTVAWSAENAEIVEDPDTYTANITFVDIGIQTVNLLVTLESKGNGKSKTCEASRQVSVDAAGGTPVARGDTYATPIGKKLTIQRSRVSGVLYNDFDTDPLTGENTGNAGLSAVLIDPPMYGTLEGDLQADGSFTYIPGSQGENDNDSFTYMAEDGDGNQSEVTTVNIHITSNQPDFKIMMNYELGMHCTGFEFSYCCVLPPYNSIVAQVVKSQADGPLISNADFPRLLTGDPNNGLDALGRETVLRDYDGDGNINKYFLEYYHDAMPRLEGNMPYTFNSTDGKDTLISAVEGNSLLYWNTPYDSAQVDTDGSITGVPGKLVTGQYGNVTYNVVKGDGSYQTPTNLGIPGGTDNFANGWLNHFYIYSNLEGTLNGSCVAPPFGVEDVTNDRCASDADCVAGEQCQFTLERDKVRLGVAGMVEYPADSGAALQPMGPTGNGTPFDNVLTFSGDTGTVVYTQMKVLENLPIMLTSPEIWEALGLPLTPFEDSINFFADPGALDEDSVRPFVAMKAKLYHAVDCDGGPYADPADDPCHKGEAVMQNGQPVIGFGTAPIDIPNCERCHSAPPYQADGVTPNFNSPSYSRRQDGPHPYFGPAGETLEEMTNLEINYWKAYYGLDPSMGDTDWYARLKGAAISIEVMHDYDVGTNFTANYPVAAGENPKDLPDYKWLTGDPDPQNPDQAYLAQNTRMGHESVICQKCHADNVIAVVKSASIGSEQGPPVPPISEAIHNSHRAQSAGGPIAFDDSLGRYGGCQGCHPAHRSDGSMDKYPITYGGDNANAGGDNRLGAGGCFVGRDVHSNPLKDKDGAETPEHLNAVGQWLQANVSQGQAGLGNSDEPTRGIWCTNCHTQLSQEIWRTEDCDDLIHSDPTQVSSPDCLVNPRAQPTLAAVAQAVGLTEQEAINFLDPKNPMTQPEEVPQVTVNNTHAAWDPAIPDANVATIEVGPDGPVGTTDADGDFSVNILSFCTTQDCVDLINNNKSDQSKWRYPENGAVDGVSGFISTANKGVPVPFSAADDARDHWLSAGEPHCADCHAAPYVEQSGNITAYPPFNYPAKASLMRYTRGHQGISCQGCHESIHGLYPVAPAIDNTSYAQAAALNADGSHGPLKCGACHEVDGNGIPSWIDGQFAGGGAISPQIQSFDDAVGWAHTYTAEANVLNTTCQNCHGVDGEFGSSEVNTASKPADWTKVASHTEVFLKHSMNGFTSRQMMDKAEMLVNGEVTGPAAGACTACHEENEDHTPVLASEGCDLDNEPDWMQHLTQGRVAESVWEDVSLAQTGTLCGW